MDWISKFLDISKVPTKIIFWIFLLSGFLLLMPSGWLTTLRLDEFLKDYGKFVGIGFVGSAVLLLVQAFLWLRQKSRQSKQKKEFEESVQTKLMQLDNFEKAVVREFYLQGKNTILLPVDDPTVAGLLQKRVLRVVSRNGEMSLAGMLFPVALSSFAEQHVTPQLVDLPTGSPTQAQVADIVQARPKFIAGIERRNWLRDL
ncbi:MAG: superinfection exclusion B family protein [Bacteroidota bacterium]|nr:superinfection exclusion B family protein [Bacteroidota bacterium]